MLIFYKFIWKPIHETLNFSNMGSIFGSSIAISLIFRVFPIPFHFKCIQRKSQAKGNFK